MEVVQSKNKEVPVKNKEAATTTKHHGLNLTVLEDKIVQLLKAMKMLKEENASLKEKNKDLQGQLKALEGSLVSETRDLEELSQEKIKAKLVVDNLLHLIETQEQ
ncbi:MAG TPA: hypothetical protein VLG50_03305 [Candidatus Saccharimonadales bacterium]|nr:hypothetical protein [Candidatus Saccharimonadales bacterium]